jgi:hypothetical protein
MGEVIGEDEDEVGLHAIGGSHAGKQQKRGGERGGKFHGNKKSVLKSTV